MVALKWTNETTLGSHYWFTKGMGASLVVIRTLLSVQINLVIGTRGIVTLIYKEALFSVQLRIMNQAEGPHFL